MDSKGNVNILWVFSPFFDRKSVFFQGAVNIPSFSLFFWTTFQCIARKESFAKKQMTCFLEKWPFIETSDKLSMDEKCYTHKKCRSVKKGHYSADYLL